jgi:UDP-N-acetylmuramoyl-L-alanyl-D-glutamate--2,6-diaminopimelate ligase
LAKLKDILFGVSLQRFEGDRELEISGIAFDSRKVQPGYLFIAVKGLNHDGHYFIQEVIEKGANAVVLETNGDYDEKTTFIQTDNSAKALGIIASNFYNNPSGKIKLVGITGTNGKTTTATLLYELFQSLGYKTGLISTVENKIGTQILDSKFTTPDAIALNELLAQMVDTGCDYAFMEVSSHALVQNRVAGVHFAVGVFTNISHDHLDYHKTFEAYIDAKKLLFDGLSSESFALVNVDDRRGKYMLQNTKASINTFAIKTMADYKARILHNTLQGLELDLNGISIWFKLIGKFNVYNILAVYGTALLLDQNSEEVLPKMSQLTGARGRFEYVQNKSNVLAIVDYAHTPEYCKH